MPSPEEKIAKLKSLLTLLDESLTKKDFLTAFDAVVKFVKDIKAANDAVMGKIEQDFAGLSGKLEKLTAQEVETAKKSVMHMCSPLMERMKREHTLKMNMVEEKLSMMDRKMAMVHNGEPGKPGKDADEEKIRKQVLKELRDELKAEYKKLFNELENRLNTKVKAIPERPTTTIFGPKPLRPTPVDLSSQLDGSTKAFSIGFNHFGIVGVFGSSSPFPFRPTIDYTEVGRNIVFDAAIDASVSLATGQTLIVQVMK